jgi:hypothetical protein
MTSPLRIALAGALLAAAPGIASADEWDVPQPAWEGVWQGTVGNLPVHVCLDKTPYEQKGAYYYDRVKRLLRLSPAEDAGQWLEQDADGHDGARWRLAAGPDGLGGTWSDGKKQLPVRLARIGGASKDFDGPCGSLAFHRPRLAPVKLTSRQASMDDASYTVWSFKPGPWFGDGVGVETFTLDRAGAPVARVNALLRAALPKPDGTGDWLDCVTGSVNALGQDGEYSESLEPTIIGERWLAVSQGGEYFCGGAHPETIASLRTFDLVAGSEVNPLDWFGPRAVHRETLDDGDGSVSRTLTPEFRAALLQGWKSDGDAAECDDAMRGQDYWNVGIARGALVFTPDFPHAIMACSDDFEMPLARLAPWLNDAGKAVVATLPR